MKRLAEKVKEHKDLFEGLGDEAKKKALYPESRKE